MGRETVDSHGHVWTTPDEHGWVDPVMPPGIEQLVYSVENYREDMAALGIDRAVLVATPIHGPGSPYTVSCVEADPDTFYGIVLVDYRATDVEAHLEDVFCHEHILGVRMTGEDLAAAPPAFWSWMNRHEKQVHLLLSPPELGEAVEYVDKYPDVDFVFDHLGLYPSAEGFAPDDPPYSEIRTIAQRRNAFAKITHTPSDEQFPFADVHEFVRTLIDAFGSERLLWGSDYIYHLKKLTPRQTREFLDELPFLSDRDHENLLGRTFDERLS